MLNGHLAGSRREHRPTKKELPRVLTSRVGRGIWPWVDSTQDLPWLSLAFCCPVLALLRGRGWEGRVETSVLKGSRGWRETRPGVGGLECDKSGQCPGRRVLKTVGRGGGLRAESRTSSWRRSSLSWARAGCDLSHTPRAPGLCD